MIGKTISHYRIIEKLGEGGMGKVYLAEDTKLKRKIALKFLPQHLTIDQEAKDRFEREAQTAATLNHPNIITIHEIGEFENPGKRGKQTYIAMEYIEGKTLRDIISGVRAKHSEDDWQGRNEIVRRNASPQRVIDIIIQICEGLAKAHQAGIVHRDIKPENILIDSDGRVKILDFGLAKLKGTGNLTKETSTLGTVYYMAPEQAKGEEVDHRTDIWSLGVVLYEMLTGQLPFKGEYEQAVIYSIINEEPETASSFNIDIPKTIEQIINKSLKKNPDLRFQKINAIIEELKKPFLEEVQPEKTKKSIIVLPFTNMSPDPEQEYFSDGLTEEIITDLSQIHDLLVISRSSAMTFKGSQKKITEIAKEVNVQYVLEGSVRKAGNNLRITAQLIDSKTDAHLWAEKYSGTLDDVFDIQEKVSRSIVDALKLELSPEEKEKIVERPITNVRAYECYLRHRQEVWKCTEDALQRALRYLQNGLDIVGENVLLYAGISNVYFQIVNNGIKPDEITLKKAEQYANKVFDLEPDSSHGHRLIGQIKLFQGNSREAYRHFRRAYEIYPNDSDTLLWLVACCAIHYGKPSIATSWAQKALEIDPLTPINHWLLGCVYWMEGKFDLALELSLQYYKMEPESLLARWYYAQMLAWNKKYDKAYEVMDKLTKNAPKHFCGVTIAFFEYALKGKKEKAMQSLTEDVRRFAWMDFHLPWFLSEGFALINEVDEALKWLENVINKGWCNYPLFNEIDPFLENIRGEERFKKLMERVKHEWENFEV